MGSWYRTLVSLELRKLFAYRASFWVEFLGSTLAHFGVSYFVWRAVFAESGQSILAGYTFPLMMLYQILVAVVGRATYAVDFSSISDEIYTGSLNRYLIYPLKFFSYRLLQQLTTNTVVVVQLLLVLLAYTASIGFPPEIDFSLARLMGFLVILLGSMLLAFLISWCIQMAAFWVDQVWSLMVSFRFAVYLFGGTLIPLSLYPERAAAILRWSPFYMLVAFPVEVFLGKIHSGEIMRSGAILLGWMVAFWCLGSAIWRRGLKSYSGVGI